MRRWYVNDASLQGQFADLRNFEAVVSGLLAARSRVHSLRTDLRTTRSLTDRAVRHDLTVRRAMQTLPNKDLRRAVLLWFDRTGPFVDDDPYVEVDDYFEYETLDVTETGLGEAARRVKAAEDASTFSFVGGARDFACSPLAVDHGIAEDRLGVYDVDNLWTTEQLVADAMRQAPPSTSWRTLVEFAQQRFPRLRIANSVYERPVLAREPFDSIIRDQTLRLLSFLNEYMEGRSEGGIEGARARHVIDNFFTGERALFTGESSSNKREFNDALTFPDPDDDTREIFAPWHGKISHLFFRLHFEWPVPAGQPTLKILYLGPKITKS